MTHDQTKQSLGFFSSDDLISVIGQANKILDPHSVLIGVNVKIGKGNIFYPNVVIEQKGAGKIIIGNNNIFYPGVYILSSDGLVEIGDGNEFGTGGCTIKANMSDANILIGDDGRYCDGLSIMGKTTLGDGSQVLGNITVQSCSLASGGTFQEPDPDKRAAVLKGFGLARGISLGQGQVMNGKGNFGDAKVEWQRDYHSKKR